MVRGHTRNQSSNANRSLQQRRCYYELLEVSRDATTDEIKRSYKKLALKWHPDKNPERKEECTAHFIQLQQAYEVLMDPQKRAHYDRNRESVIRNGWSEQESTRVYENYDADLDEIFREFYGYDNYHYEHFEQFGAFPGFFNVYYANPFEPNMRMHAQNGDGIVSTVLQIAVLAFVLVRSFF